MNKLNIISITLLVLGAGCYLLFSLIGSEVDDPIGAFLIIVLGLIVGLVNNLNIIYEMNKLNIISITLLVLGAGCYLLFSLIGSEVDDKGVLREPFGLLPIGAFLIVLGLVVGLVSFILTKVKKNK